MADSVDRVFVHALNTVKKIPKTGAARPPPADRMRLYGLYKQAMEGDVDGVMERPGNRAGMPSDELRREQDKWDSWYAERGLSRTEAKRRYIETLIDTMHTYATTPSSAELVAELEFVWNQIKDNDSPSSTASYRKENVYRPHDEDHEHRRTSMSQSRASAIYGAGAGAGFGYGGYTDSGIEGFADAPGGPLKMLTPMSEEDEVEREHRMRLIDEELAAADDDEAEGGAGPNTIAMAPGRFGADGPRDDKWSRKVERAMVKLSAEIAALREQISAGREFRARQARRPMAWLGWITWAALRHVTIDVLLLFVLLLWFRRRKDRRVEDHVRGALQVVREYLKKVLPSR